MYARLHQWTVPPMRLLPAIATSAILLTPAVIDAQNAAAAGPVFDVAAIHLHEAQPHEHNSIWSSPQDGHFVAENISVIALIRFAYQIPETRILNAPAWAGSEHFNIEAKTDAATDDRMRTLAPEAGRQQKELMVQALLADRFKLMTHLETREQPIYELVVAKKGAKLGTLQISGSSVSASTGRIEIRSANSVGTLAEELSKVVGRDVVDKTGIAGRYDLTLRWSNDELSPNATGPTDSGPSIFTALEEQLGLRLAPATGPVTVLVVDRVERPSPN
jgi:uncharacterized protein (TIGR03435 family)